MKNEDRHVLTISLELIPSRCIKEEGSGMHTGRSMNLRGDALDSKAAFLVD